MPPVTYKGKTELHYTLLAAVTHQAAVNRGACEPLSLPGRLQYAIRISNASLKVLPALNYFINFCIKSYNHKRPTAQFIGHKTAVSGSLVTASPLTSARRSDPVKKKKKNRTRLTLERQNQVLSPALVPFNQRSSTNGRPLTPRRLGKGGPARPYLVEVQLSRLGGALHGGGSQTLQQAPELRRRQAPVGAEHAQHILAEGEPGHLRLPSEASGRQQQEPSHRSTRSHRGRGCPSRAQNGLERTGTGRAQPRRCPRAPVRRRRRSGSAVARGAPGPPAPSK